MNKLSIAGLLHIFGWSGEKSKIILEDGLTIKYAPDSNIISFYNTLCYDNGIDDGEPFNYEVYILSEKDFKDFDFAFGTPFSIIDYVANIIAVNIFQPIGMCRVIISKDNFKTLHSTSIIFSYGVQSEALFIDDYKITDDVKLCISKCYKNLKEIGQKQNLRRLRNSLDYFYYAWRSPFLEQTNINLAISLESLFSPASNSELSHQISFNIAKFLSNKHDEQVALYDSIKKFYSVRSKIVHGASPNDEVFWDNTIEIFHLTAKILRKILLDKNLIEIFNDNKKRTEYLRNSIFK